ncbi:type II toxin-antitoxin system RelE/ParE family toxin [Leclercia sp.]|uniref:type II toxin-antitoxin system RelE/ParE family toxin n=1 Tax=Leclercia sp. TaxID=1898428 RepID=UPI00289DE55B|nr:type II toxin-antitoxin system RelE/ParE family toxin [Leclercia sp.]
MWKIETTDTFDRWLSSLDDRERSAMLAALIVLQTKGPLLPRPWADTIKRSLYHNMKELRVQCGGQPLRAFFAFDPFRTGIILCAGNKAGNEKRFYEEMIPLADRELTAYLNNKEGKE